MKKELIIDENLLLFAFRYAVNRDTFAPYIVEQSIKKNIDELSNVLLLSMIDVMNESSRSKSLQYEFDVFREYLRGILSERKSDSCSKRNLLAVYKEDMETGGQDDFSFFEMDNESEAEEHFMQMVKEHKDYRVVKRIARYDSTGNSVSF